MRCGLSGGLSCDRQRITSIRLKLRAAFTQDSTERRNGQKLHRLMDKPPTQEVKRRVRGFPHEWGFTSGPGLLAGTQDKQTSMLTLFSIEARIPSDHH